VGKERVSTCAGSITLLQGGVEHSKILISTPSLKMNKKKKVVMRVEGNCCWTVHARKKFKGFKTFVRSQGEMNLSSKRLRSISKTECSTISLPRIYMAGSGWVGVIGVVVLGIILAILSVKYKFGKKKEYEVTLISESLELNDLDKEKELTHPDEDEKMPIKDE